MIMADTVSFDSLLNTTTGMTAIVNNKKHDDDVVSVTGVDWFTYAGKTASTIYVSGNNFIGFGQNAEQLKIWRRNGAVYYIYRQEGMLASGKRFLKIRVEGYVYYSLTYSTYALKYEVFLIEGQTLFINVTQIPTDNYYKGISSITDGKSTTDLAISVTSTVPISILVKNAGVSQIVSYEKFVEDKYVTGITVSKMPNKTTYYQGELFDSTGLEVSKTYNDGTSESTTDYELSGFDSSSAGTKTITVTASGKTTTFEISVSEASITAISVTTMPSKVNYHIGKEFDSTGIVVTATLSDGNTIDVTKDCTYSGFDSSSPKTNTITVTYGILTTTFDITIMQPLSITGGNYSSDTYFVGETTDISVYSITVSYSDGFEYVTSGYTVNNVVVTEPGSLLITVEYFGVSTTVSTKVLDSFSVKIGTPTKDDVTAIFDLETNILSILGTGEFNNNLSDNAEGIACPNSLYTRCKQIVFSDGITKIPSNFGSRFSSLENLVFGNDISEIGVGNFNKYLGTSLSFSESFVKISSGCFNDCPNLSELTFHEGLEEIGRSTFCGCSSLKNLILPSTLKSMSYCFQGGTLENLEIGGNDAIFASSGEGGTIYNISAKNLVIRGGTIYSNAFNRKNIETLALNGTVKWNGTGQFATCSELRSISIGKGISMFTVEVVPDTVGIRISHYPNKIYYRIGESFDPTGLTVAAVRQDGTEKEITDYDISGFDSSTAGSKTITVSYNVTANGTSKFVGSDSFQIKVTNDGKNPFDDSSGGGSGGGSGEVEEEKTEPINVTVHWINGEFADLTNENIDQNTLALQESICSEQYFIFGGCVCNQITFQAHHDQFNGTSEEFYPHGKIEVYIERKGTEIKIFTGEIDSAERKANSLTRNFIAYDYLYKLRNTDIARWYKNQTTDKKKKLTQKQFRDKLFEFLGLEQVSTKLHWDDTYVPDTNNSNEMNVVNILKDLCLQNDRFGWMNRDGKFEYLKLRQNSYRYGQTTGNQNIYKYYGNEEVHLDTFKSFTAKEGRIWFPNVIFCDPDPNRAFGFTQSDYTAQEAYDNNVYYNRNSFFVGNEDWLNYVWDADEYGGISRAEPIMKICYGVFVNQDLRKYYRAQGYTAEVQGNPLNMVGQAVELYYKKQIQHDDQEPTELQWYVHSYIMSRTLKIGATDMIDTYSANNAPFNSNSQQLGKYTPEISGTVNLTRSEMPTISYAEFTDSSDSEFSPATIDDFTDGSGGSSSTSEQLKKAQLRCVKRIKKADYDALVAAGTDRTDTLYFTFEEG
jgi:hypothetical protein